MSFSLLPSIQIDAITGLTAADLKKLGIRLLMLDFDNTIVPYTTDIPTEEMLAWLQEMNASDVQICVVSNSKNSRVPRFCETYDIDCITHAKKPFSDGIVRCLEKYNIPPEKCALAGDQIFTDTLGANCAGVKSILVKAIDNHNIWLKLRHVAELPFIYISKNRSISL